MVNIETAQRKKTGYIRKININSDLLQVADLIEMCFSSNMDEDGRAYLQQIRRAAVDPWYRRWIPGASESVSVPLYGYVWEEDGRVVGNLSLLPVRYRGHWRYLIANVAVHPEYRRRKIASKLAQRALNHIKTLGVKSAWLQVRADNDAAINMYLSHGFKQRSKRTNWINKDGLIPDSYQFDEEMKYISTGERQNKDWSFQYRWLQYFYPPDVAWYYQMEPIHLSPFFLQKIIRWIEGRTIKHWSLRANGQLVGVASWERSRQYADSLWVAYDPNTNVNRLRDLLIYARTRVSGNKPLVVNYPYGVFEAAFKEANFSIQNTLIWMEHKNT